MLTAAAVTGILSVPGGYAFADADVDSLVSDPTSVLADSLPSAVGGPLAVCDDGVTLGDSGRASRDDCVSVTDVLGGGSGGRSYGESPDDCDEPGDEPAGPDSPEPDSPRPDSPRPHAPERPAAHQARTLPAPAPQLAETGGDPTTLVAGGLGAVLLAGGGILYRRGRVAARR
ncbi:LPXTG cell wall anchor domain-containing protein [Streptomyces sp. TS71-3]|uniref:LPXTG cell wall anchor domain-containing protein n=1 Tax=Streptomyces sp. TS71-3 TaxID=2733862 RepID=UPI001BB3C49E|nr:LPXTG cell wall anchor domain-containing protein [Streptomyces sp. TS71-3]